MSVLECFKIRETGEVYCFVDEIVEGAGFLAIAKADPNTPYDYEESWNDLPKSVKQAIQQIRNEVKEK